MEGDLEFSIISDDESLDLTWQTNGGREVSLGNSIAAPYKVSQHIAILTSNFSCITQSCASPRKC